MATARNKRQEGRSIPLGVTFGSITAMGLCTILSGVLAFLISNGSLKEELMGIAIPLILFIASCGGCMLSAKGAGSQLAVLCGITCAVFLVLLVVINILFFDAGFSNLLVGLLPIFGGGAVASLLCAGKRKKKRHR